MRRAVACIELIPVTVFIDFVIAVDSPTDSEPWVFYRGAEYLLVQQPFDWDSVSLACQMMGAYLLSIHSREELHFVKEHMRRVCVADINTA